MPKHVRDEFCESRIAYQFARRGLRLFALKKKLSIAGHEIFKQRAQAERCRSLSLGCRPAANFADVIVS
jgi:hypothetical protein